jgi:tRNA (guanine9-N1)-methyltransferase
MEEDKSTNKIIDDNYLPISLPSSSDNNIVLTKSALKRQKKQAIFEANKPLRKKLQKEKKKENNRKKQAEYNKNKIIKNTEIGNNRAIFVGNCQSDDEEPLVTLFISKGLSVISCDMKLGFAFVYCQISDNLSDVIQELNGQSLPGGKPLSVAFAKVNEVKELIESNPTLTTEERKLRKLKENEDYLIKCSNNFAVIIDLEWEKDHRERPLKSLSQQILFCHGINKRANNPANIYLTSLNEKSALRTKFEKLSMENWIGITSSSLDYIHLPMFCQNKPSIISEDQLNDSNMNIINNINNKKQLVYLTSDAEETLESLDDNCAYIIGGIVDRNSMKGITYNKACKQNIRSAKLPIKENFPITATHVLTVNHVFDILLNYKKFGNWKEALYAVLPLKKSEARVNKKRVRENNNYGDNDEEYSNDEDNNNDEDNIDENNNIDDSKKKK